MLRIVGLAGSLRSGSLNAALLSSAAGLAPEGCAVEIATIRGIPLYDGDAEERDGIPPAVAALKDRIAAARGLLLATPEYNGSIPGPLKNAIDWLSRPSSDIPRVFHGRAVGLIGVTPGRLGTALAQAAWLPVLRALGLRLWTGGQLQLAGARGLFDAEGQLVDEATRDRIRDYVAGFVDFARLG